MSNYYTVSQDFGNVSPNIGQLDNEIKTYIIQNPGNITTPFIGITNFINQDFVLSIANGENVIEVIFSSTISVLEKTFLDGIISTHVPVFPVITSENKTILLQSTINKSSYKRLVAVILPNMTYAKAQCISYMFSNTTSYTIQIFDKENKQILLEKILTNTDESIQDLGVLTNLPSSEQIEINVKVNGPKAYIESLTIFYN